MSMDEKFGAIWIEIDEDGSAEIVFEQHFSNIQKLHVIYQQANGYFLPCSYVQKENYQWRLPFWSQENEKAMLPTLESAKEYLKHYAEAHE